MALDFIDPWAEDWWSHLVALHASLPGGAHLHLLIDSAFKPGLCTALQQAGASLACLFDGNPGDPDVLRTVTPMLWPFDPHQLAVQRQLAQGSGAPMISAIVSPESLSALAARLRPWCVVEVDGQWFNCRYPDTRRLPGFYAALTSDQRGHLSGPAMAWHFMGRDGQWASLDVQAQDLPPLTEVRLSKVQFAQILDDAQADEILFKFMMQGQHQGRQHSVLHAQVVQALHTARAQALDEALYATWCGHWVSKMATRPESAPMDASDRQMALREWMQENTA